MAYRIELVVGTSQQPILVWDITDEIVRAYSLHSDDALTTHILRGLQLMVTLDEAKRCAAAVLKSTNRSERLSVKLRGNAPATGTTDAELIRLRDRAERAEKSALRLKDERDGLSQKLIAMTAENTKLRGQVTQARSETNTARTAAQAQIAAHQAELQLLRQRQEEHKSKTSAAANETHKLRRQLEDLETERAELLRRLGGNPLLTADRDLR